MARYQCIPKRAPASTEVVHTEDWLDKSDATVRASQVNSQAYFHLLEHIYSSQLQSETKRRRQQAKPRRSSQNAATTPSGVRKQSGAKATSLLQRRDSTVSLQALELNSLDCSNMVLEKTRSESLQSIEAGSSPSSISGSEPQDISSQNSPTDAGPLGLDPEWTSWFRSTLLEELGIEAE